MKNHTDINILIDASGSMYNMKSEVEGAVASLIDQQKASGDNATLTIADFDTQQKYNVVKNAESINDVVNNYSFRARGGTPLLDALGQMINTTGNRLSSMDESERPDKVVIMIFTDGGENSSYEFDVDKIKNMIEEQKNKYNWEFNFMSSDLSAVNQAQSFGFDSTDTAYSPSLLKGVQVYGGKLSNVRGGTVASMAYTDEEKVDLENG